MDFRNFTTHAAERRRAGAILGTPPPVDGRRTGVHHCLELTIAIVLRSLYPFSGVGQPLCSNNGLNIFC